MWLLAFMFVDMYCGGWFVWVCDWSLLVGEVLCFVLYWFSWFCCLLLVFWLLFNSVDWFGLFGLVVLVALVLLIL